jgi:hypothetical protein
MPALAQVINTEVGQARVPVASTSLWQFNEQGVDGRNKSGHDVERLCLSFAMPGLVPGIHVLKTVQFTDVDGRDIGVRKHAVLRTAMPGHDSKQAQPHRILL